MDSKFAPPTFPDLSLHRTRPRPSGSGTLISLAFWACLLLAASLYALVALAPKIVRWSERSATFAANQDKLLQLRQEIDLGERLAREWSLAQDVATSSVEGAAERSFVVEEALRYRPPRADQTEGPLKPQRGSVFRACELVAASSALQAAALMTSAGLLLLAFTILMDPAGGRNRSCAAAGPHRLPAISSLPGRYRSRRPPEVVER